MKKSESMDGVLQLKQVYPRSAGFSANTLQKNPTFVTVEGWIMRKLMGNRKY